MASERRKATTKRYRDANREALQAAGREYYQRNRERIRAENRQVTDPQRIREWRLKAKFGITLQDYERMNQEQNGACAICDGRGQRILAVDHDHKTGKVRSLLCDRCNPALGSFRDDPELLRKAALYIEKYRE